MCPGYIPGISSVSSSVEGYVNSFKPDEQISSPIWIMFRDILEQQGIEWPKR